MASLIVGYVIIYGCLVHPFLDMNLMRVEYNAIRQGMSVEEVEDILGKSPLPELEGERVWGGSGGIITVQFEGRRVSWKKFTPVERLRKWPRIW